MSAITYEHRLNSNRRWALEEGGLHFERSSEVYRSLERITQRLDSLGIHYAVVGAMAMFLHGFRRFTEDVDLLVTREELKLIHEQLEGRGYIPPFAGSKNLRDADTGVRIEFLVAGDYPGDGKPKPVTFPDPDAAATIVDGIRCLNLPRLVEIKLASGMTNPARLKDLADVQEMIATLNLPPAFADELNSFVRAKFMELYHAVASDPNRREY